jgi:hypothetical protein
MCGNIQSYRILKIIHKLQKVKYHSLHFPSSYKEISGERICSFDEP